MKYNKLTQYPAPLALTLGCVVFCLQFVLRGMMGTNGLLPHAHSLHIASAILCILTVPAAVYLVNKGKGFFVNGAVFPASIPAALAWAAGAVCTALLAAGIFRNAMEKLDVLDGVLAVVGAVCMAAVALGRKKGQPPHFLWYAGICVFFTFHMVCRYRTWSSIPQLSQYMIPMLACVFLSLTAYYRTAFRQNMCSVAPLQFCALMAEFTGVAALAIPGSRIFFLAGILCCLASTPSPLINREENNDVSA